MEESWALVLGARLVICEHLVLVQTRLGDRALVLLAVLYDLEKVVLGI